MERVKRARPVIVVEPGSPGSFTMDLSDKPGWERAEFVNGSFADPWGGQPQRGSVPDPDGKAALGGEAAMEALRQAAAPTMGRPFQGGPTRPAVAPPQPAEALPPQVASMFAEAGVMPPGMPPGMSPGMPPPVAAPQPEPPPVRVVFEVAGMGEVEAHYARVVRQGPVLALVADRRRGGVAVRPTAPGPLWARLAAEGGDERLCLEGGGRSFADGPWEYHVFAVARSERDWGPLAAAMGEDVR